MEKRALQREDWDVTMYLLAMRELLGVRLRMGTEGGARGNQNEKELHRYRGGQNVGNRK